MRKLSCKTARLAVLTFLVYALLVGPAESARMSTGPSILEPPLVRCSGNITVLEA